MDMCLDWMHKELSGKIDFIDAFLWCFQAHNREQTNTKSFLMQMKKSFKKNTMKFFVDFLGFITRDDLAEKTNFRLTTS